MKAPFALALVALLVGCAAPPPTVVRYTLGEPYEADGVWRQPRASFSYDATGIATIEKAPRTGLTSDGERYSPRAFAAAQPTLQLPAIARVTNLENGRQIVVRINERGPADPARIIAVTPAVARALAFGSPGLARVRVRLLPGPSEQLALSLPGGPRVPVARAPLAPVQESALSPLPGVGAAPPTPRVPARAAAPAAPFAIPAADRPGARSQVSPRPGALWVRTGTFADASDAELQARTLARFGARAITSPGTLRTEVRIGPFASIARGDAMLKEVLGAGFAGARLVVE